MFPLYSYVDPNRYRLSSDDVRDIQSSLRRAIKALTYVISLYHRARHLCPQFEARWSRDNWRKIFSFQDGVFWWMFPELSSHLRYWSQESCSSFWGWQVLTDQRFKTTAGLPRAHFDWALSLCEKIAASVNPLIHKTSFFVDEQYWVKILR